MIRDGQTINSEQCADVCVIGTGQAGITAAWELHKAGKNVLLLDGSRMPKGGYNNPEDPNYVTQSYSTKKLLYGGNAAGLFKTNEPEFLILPQYLDQSPSERERAYGGTSTHWGGQSRPFDPIVFEARPGFIGWPIDRSDLDPYYGHASRLCHLVGEYEKDGVSGYNFSTEFWAEREGLKEIPDLEGFNVEMYQFMATDFLNFAIRSFRDEKAQKDGQIGDFVDVIVNATVLDIETENGSVCHLKVASMTDGEDPQKATEFTVKADAYILACGAVANAQRLLLSEIGSDQVGRYFMCQPSIFSPVNTITGNFLSLDQISFMGYHGATATEPGFTGTFIAKGDVAREFGIGRCWFHAGSAGSSSGMYFEMAPNYESYVALTAPDTVDPIFKQRLTYINWNFDNPEYQDIDKKTYETNSKLFGESAREYAQNHPTSPTQTSSVGASLGCQNTESSGFLNYCAWDELRHKWVVNGHHIGTTRMSSSQEPEKGVVDQNLKVHELDNLYVAGSSVFPTAGLSNPTMTIIALSIRLAEHLAPQVGN